MVPVPDHQRLERGRTVSNGFDALSCLVPVLHSAYAGWKKKTLLPALPAQRRRFPGCSFQYRFLCFAHADAGTGVRSDFSVP